MRSLTGRRFGLLKVISKNTASGRTLYECICECGGTSKVPPYSLTSGNTKSCGCMRGALRHYEALYNRIKDRAIHDGVEFAITYAYFLRFTKKETCHYCDEPLAWHKRLSTKFRVGPKSNLDRKDSSRGYIKGNLVACCKLCNWTKADRFTYEEFLMLSPALKHIRRVRMEKTCQNP